LSKKKYSSYVNEDKIIYIDELGQKEVSSLSEVRAKSLDGFLLDGVSKKIYYN